MKRGDNSLSLIFCIHCSTCSCDFNHHQKQASGCECCIPIAGQIRYRCTVIESQVKRTVCRVDCTSASILSTLMESFFASASISVRACTSTGDESTLSEHKSEVILHLGLLLLAPTIVKHSNDMSQSSRKIYTW